MYSDVDERKILGVFIWGLGDMGDLEKVSGADFFFKVLIMQVSIVALFYPMP